jgi:uncharacterized protein YgbK (DUF1537 family)
MTKPLICFYGDDFTGSTDALECLAGGGLRAALFMKPPTRGELAQHPGLQAIGVAGVTRSLRTAELEAALRPALGTLKELGPKHVYYKVCSTFDSSPAVGSIGKAIDIGREMFEAPFIPLLVAAPGLGRHCAFGNLFARIGVGGEVFRLDRHPSMRRHPITPAEESDLRLHLARQTTKRIALFDILKSNLPQARAGVELETVLRQKPDVVLFDAIYEEQLTGLGALIDEYANPGPLFSVGSSGLAAALASHWAMEGAVKAVLSWPDPGEAKPVLVLAGSCSPVTIEQVKWAWEHGYAGVELHADELLEAAVNEVELAEMLAAKATEHLGSGRNVIVHTGYREPVRTADVTGQRQDLNQLSVLIGTTLGRIARTVLERVSVRRLCVAGGDTSGCVARALGLEILEMIGPIVPGAPLCRARARGSPADGVEVCFKGGQIGGADFFDLVANGSVGRDSAGPL